MALNAIILVFTMLIGQCMQYFAFPEMVGIGPKFNTAGHWRNDICLLLLMTHYHYDSSPII